MTDSANRQTYADIRARFDNPQTARNYLRKKGKLDNARNRREMACIVKGLQGLQPGSIVLDLPCGAGRLLPMLLDRQFQVVAADFSSEMLGVAEDYYREQFRDTPEIIKQYSFVQQDILHTTFENNSFDAIICNRLLHHYPDADLRRDVLRELMRIIRPDGRLIVSFFSNFATSAALFHLKNALKGVTPRDRVPIWHRVFKQDYQAAGWYCTGYYPVFYGKSPQTYLKLEPGNA